MTKTCEGCHNEFITGRYQTQKFCTKACSTRAWRQANPEKHAEYSKKNYNQRPERTKPAYIKRTYGLEWDQYQEMIANGCAVCGSTEKLCIDHDHSCCNGKTSCGQCIRGVLCDRHNKAEGLLRSNVDECIALATYLLNTSKEVSNGNQTV